MGFISTIKTKQKITTNTAEILEDAKQVDENQRSFETRKDSSLFEIPVKRVTSGNGNRM